MRKIFETKVLPLKILHRLVYLHFSLDPIQRFPFFCFSIFRYFSSVLKFFSLVSTLFFRFFNIFLQFAFFFIFNFKKNHDFSSLFSLYDTSVRASESSSMFFMDLVGLKESAGRFSSQETFFFFCRTV